MDFLVLKVVCRRWDVEGAGTGLVQCQTVLLEKAVGRMKGWAMKSWYMVGRSYVKRIFEAYIELTQAPL